MSTICYIFTHNWWSGFNPFDGKKPKIVVWTNLPKVDGDEMTRGLKKYSLLITGMVVVVMLFTGYLWFSNRVSPVLIGGISTPSRSTESASVERYINTVPKTAHYAGMDETGNFEGSALSSDKSAAAVRSAEEVRGAAAFTPGTAALEGKTLNENISGEGGFSTGGAHVDEITAHAEAKALSGRQEQNTDVEFATGGSSTIAGSSNPRYEGIQTKNIDMPSTRDATSSESSQKEKNNNFKAVDAAIKKLEEANIVFNTPKTLKLDEVSEIQLVLGVAVPVAFLKNYMSVPGETDSATVKISQDVSARLTGAGFAITEVTESRQPITLDEITEWKWQIVPQREGMQRLHLSISAEIDVNGTSMRKVVRTFDKDINIDIGAGEVVAKFFSTNWQWLFAAILVPVFGWGMKKINKSRVRRTDD